MNPLFILPFILASLIVALLSGLVRIGWSLPVSHTAGHHGAIMIGSFLSSLIMLERAVTFKNKWILLLPLLNAISIIFFLRGDIAIALYLLIAGSAGFAAMCLYFIYTYKDAYYYLFFIGASCLLIGNVMLLQSNFYPQAAPWWMGFLLFTIVAERLELTRFLQLPRGSHLMLYAALAIVIAGLVIPFHMHGDWIFASGLVLTACWLLRYDMAFKSMKKAGQHRYSALLLITGYAWLLFAAMFLFAGSENPFLYDATLHAFFIGFVFSMIFSHSPIILPAVLRLPVKPYRPFLYVWFVLLQVSLVLRMVADAAVMVELRRIAGMINGLVILFFFISMMVILKIELAKRKH